jgi:excisionase family DNA binding protein
MAQPESHATAPATAALSEPSASLLTVKEYAAAKRVHPETVKRWCRDGKLPAERVGRLGHWRILVERAA